MQISLLMHIINIIEKNYSFIKEKYYLASTSNRKMLLKIIKQIILLYCHKLGAKIAKLDNIEEAVAHYLIKIVQDNRYYKLTEKQDN